MSKVVPLISAPFRGSIRHGLLWQGGLIGKAGDKGLQIGQNGTACL